MLWFLVAVIVWAAYLHNDFLHRQAMIQAAWDDLKRQLSYPDRPAHAQAVLDATEYHNALVRDYNVKLRFIPERFIAKLAKFQPKTPYEHAG